MKTEPVAVRKPLQSLSRQLLKKQQREYNQDLLLVD